MEYILTQIILSISSLLLSLNWLLGVSIKLPQETMTVVGTTTAQVTNVIDGDTIDVIFAGLPDTVRVRYIGIDTPEPYANESPECGSTAATTRNKELVKGKIVTIVPGVDSYDNYGRLLAYVYAGDTFVNQALVAEGFASVLMIKPNTYYNDNFTEGYKNARAKKKGMWAVCE